MNISKRYVSIVSAYCILDSLVCIKIRVHGNHLIQIAVRDQFPVPPAHGDGGTVVKNNRAILQIVNMGKIDKNCAGTHHKHRFIQHGTPGSDCPFRRNRILPHMKA